MDQTIDALSEYMEPGDIIIDGGNEWWVAMSWEAGDGGQWVSARLVITPRSLVWALLLQIRSPGNQIQGAAMVLACHSCLASVHVTWTTPLWVARFTACGISFLRAAAINKP